MTTSTPSPSGDRVRTLRGHQGLTQTDLASKAGISPTTIATMETGERRVRPATVRRIARALGVSPAELFDADEVVAAPKSEPPRERPVEPDAGASLLEEQRLLVRGWEVIFKDLGARYREAFEEIRDDDSDVFSNKVIDVAVLAGHLLRLLSRESAEIREAPGVVAAVEEIRNASASVERIIEQKPSPTDDAHAEQIAAFRAARDAATSLTSIGEHQNDDGRARSAS